MRKFITENLKMALLEYQIVDAEYYNDRIELTVGGIDYNVYFVPHGYIDGYLKYNLTFRPIDGKFDDNVGKDSRHAIELINNVAHHAFKVAEKKKIRYIEFSGIKDSKRKNDTNDLNNIRSRWYKNFIEKKYGRDILSVINDEFLLDVSKVLKRVVDWKRVDWEQTPLTDSDKKMVENMLSMYAENFLGTMTMENDTLHLRLGYNKTFQWDVNLARYGERLMYNAYDLVSGMRFVFDDIDELEYNIQKYLHKAGIKIYKGKRIVQYLMNISKRNDYKIEGKGGLGFNYTFHKMGVGYFSVKEVIDGDEFEYHLNLTMNDGSTEKNLVTSSDDVAEIVSGFELILHNV
jgi:hypothetical protein